MAVPQLKVVVNDQEAIIPGYVAQGPRPFNDREECACPVHPDTPGVRYCAY